MNSTTQAVVKSFDQYVSQIERYKGIREQLKSELEGFVHGLMFCADLDSDVYKDLLKKMKDIRKIA